MGIVQIDINEKIYLKNPDQSQLGRRILQSSILLLAEMGFERFTFKKLAKELGSTEASIYRYFENKHKLLVYLVSWYWNWLEYHFVLQIRGMEDPQAQLKIALKILSHPIEMDPTFMHIDESALHRIVVAESAKAFHTKEVDRNASAGYFQAYQRLCKRMASIISHYNPGYPFPMAITTTIIETAHSQEFFSIHLPSLTEISSGKGDTVEAYLNDLLFRVIAT